MGIFDFFRTYNASDTAKTMVDEYNQWISEGLTPKDALLCMYGAIKNRNADLKHLENGQYFEYVFRDEWANLSDNPDEAKKFVVTAMMNIITAYLHPEISSLREGLNLNESNFFERGKKQRAIEQQIIDSI